MSTDNPAELPYRGHPIHPVPANAGNRPIIIFLTICAKNRGACLATDPMHALLLAAWQNSTHWLVGRYVIMPDHIHLFCAPNSYPATALGSWISFWKRQTSFAHGGALWQKNFWDVQLRGHESYAAKWEYGRNNPVRAGLVTRSEDWIFQGEVNVLRWHN